MPRDAAFYNYVETARSKGLITGYAAGTFVPNGNVTRGQLSKMLYKHYTSALSEARRTAKTQRAQRTQRLYGFEPQRRRGAENQ